MKAALAAGAATLLAAAAPARAQIAGLPTLQSPFATPQVAAALNVGRGDDVDVIGVAGGWTPPSARLQLSGGLARASREDADAGYAAGARAYVPLRSFLAGAVGVGALVGVGAERTEDVTRYTAPIGASVGYRRALGATRAFAVYAVPFYSYTGVRSPSASSFLFRFAAGADLALIPRVGLTVGLEGGQEPEAGDPGLRGQVLGAGLSYTF